MLGFLFGGFFCGCASSFYSTDPKKYIDDREPTISRHSINGFLLETFRSYHKLSQNEVATKMGYRNRAQISKIENGHAKITDSKLQKLLKETAEAKVNTYLFFNLTDNFCSATSKKYKIKLISVESKEQATPHFLTTKYDDIVTINCATYKRLSQLNLKIHNRKQLKEEPSPREFNSWKTYSKSLLECKLNNYFNIFIPILNFFIEYEQSKVYPRLLKSANTTDLLKYLSSDKI